MPRAFDRGVPAVDKNPLISGTNYNDPQGIIGDAAGFFGQQLREGIPRAIRDVTGIDITGIVEFMDWIVEQFGELFSLATWVDILTPIIELFDQLITDIGSDTFPIISELVTFLSGLFDGAGSVLDWLEGIVPFNLSEVLSQFETFLTALTDRETWLTTLQTLIDALAVITDFPGWVTILKTLINGLLSLGESPLAGLTAWLSWLWTQFGATAETFLKPLFTWLSTANLQSLNSGIINTLWSLLNGGAEGISKTLADVLNSIGDFIEGLVPAITGIPGALSIGDISTWAEGVLTKGLTWPDFKTYFGEIPDTILGVLPVSNINLINPELMTQGGFDTSVTLAAGTGWAWDGTTTNSGSGGSAKVTGNGTARSLYSNQSIAVAPGDKLFISCYVKSTGTVGAGAITLSVVEFSGTTVAATQSAGAAIASRAGSSTFVQIGSTPTVGTAYTVPAGVTSIRVKVAVTSGAATGSTVWFDDISVKKTGLLSGSWMQGVLGTMIEDLQAAIDQLVQGIKGGVGSGTLVVGATTSIKAALQSIFTTLFGPANAALPTSLALNPLLATAIPGLNATKITEGDFPSERIRARSIVTDKIALDAVTTAEIGPLAVTSAELGTDAVTTAKIATDAVTTNEIGPLAVTTAELGTDAVTTAKIATNAVTANEIANSTITTTQFASTTIPAIGTVLGTAITTGSGGKQSRTNTATKVTAAAGDNKFSAFFVNPSGSIVEQRSADITIPVNGRFTVTYAGYYIVELGFTVNASTPAAGFFNVAPAIFLNGAVTSGGVPIPLKVGADSLGSFGGGLGNYSRSAHSTFIVYMGAGHYIEAGYRNFGSSNANFFQGDANGDTTFFSIAMLNRTAEG